MIKLTLIIKEIYKNNKELSVLLMENRVDDFKDKYETIPDDVKDTIIKNDPSSSKKYLDWMGRVVQLRPDVKLDDLFKYVKEFDKNQSALGDIYKFKTHDDLKRALDTRQKSNREMKREGANILIDNDEFLVVAPTDHDSCRYYGNNTRWCITGSEEYWNDYYYKNSIVILLDKRSNEKYAIVGNDEYYTVYDRNDHTLNYSGMFGDGEDSWPEYIEEVIQDYISSDNIESRKEKHNEIIIESFVENYGTDSIWERYITHINNEYKVSDSPTSLESFKNVARINGIDDKQLKELIINFLWNQLHDGVHDDDLGKFSSSNELRMSLDETEDGIGDKLEQIDVDYIHGQRNVDGILDILQQSISPQEYTKLYNNGTIDEDIFDAITKYNQLLNSKNQLSFDNQETKESVQINNINDLIYVLKRTGYENVAGYLESLVGKIRESIKPTTIAL